MKKEMINRILSSLIIVPISFFFILKGSFFFSFFLTICFLISCHEWVLMSRKKNYLFLGVLFLIFSFYTVFLLRFGNEELVTIFYIVILTCISTDIGGYVFGKLFKGPKLTKISPNKTFSGMLGGYFLTIIILNIFINNKNFFNNLNIKIDNNLDFSLQTFVLILLISTISQIGDLIVSYFKRLSKLKNTGKLIPGHGGILDRIDGMIFAFPFSYLLILFLK